jgi:protein SCO1/2
LAGLLAACGAVGGTGSVPAAAPPTPIILGGAGEPSPFQGFVMSPERPAPAIELTDQRGQPWRLADARGKVVALFFGYSHCPDICPQTMNILAQAMNELGPQAQDVEVVLVTVDPDRDTPEVIGRYVEGFYPAFVGLTGSNEAIQQLAAEYGARFLREVPAAQSTAAAALAAEHAGDSAAATAGAGGHAEEQPTAGTPGAAATGEAEGHAHGTDDVSADLEPGTAAYTVGHTSTVFLIDPQGQLRASFLGTFTPDEVAHDIRVLLDERG